MKVDRDVSLGRYSVVVYAAREHGLAGLQSLLESTRYQVAGVFTHRRLPKSESVSGEERPEFRRFQELCDEADCPLYTVDKKHDVSAISQILEGQKFDLNASISWRFLIPPEHLRLARIGGVNLHRGQLPQFAGAEPIKRMLQAGLDYACITAHVLDTEIDAGAPLRVIKHTIRPDSQLTLDENVARIKTEITPYFGPLLIRSLDELVTRFESQND